MKAVTYSKSAIKTLRRLPTNERKRIEGKIDQYAADPASQANNVKALQGMSLIRLRVGDWRVSMDDQGTILEVLKVGPRGSVYG